MPQLNYPLTGTPAQPGQIFDEGSVRDGDIVSASSKVVIPFGVLCEIRLADGQAQPVSETGAHWPPSSFTAARLYGISVFDPMGAEQTYPAIGGSSSCAGYPAGVRVPFMRRGRIWMSFDNGGTKVKFGAFNIWHSSDGTHPQGVATFTATAATAGAEIDTCPVSMEVFDPDSLGVSYTDVFGVAQGVLPVSINLPGYGS